MGGLTIPRILATALVALLALAACSGPPLQPLRFGEAVWRPGETSVYRVTDVDGNHAGSVRYVLDALEGGGWRMVRVTQTQGDEETLLVDMDPNGFRPRSSMLTRLDGGGRQSVETTYGRGSVGLALTGNDNQTKHDTASVPSDARDARALFMLARTLPLEKRYSTRVNTFSPVTARLARPTVTVLGSEQVTTQAGTFDAWLVALDDADLRSRLWIAKDPPHALVKYEDAANGGLFELAEFEAGR